MTGYFLGVGDRQVQRGARSAVASTHRAVFGAVHVTSHCRRLLLVLHELVFMLLVPSPVLLVMLVLTLVLLSVLILVLVLVLTLLLLLAVVDAAPAALFTKQSSKTTVSRNLMVLLHDLPDPH